MSLTVVVDKIDVEETNAELNLMAEDLLRRMNVRLSMNSNYDAYWDRDVTNNYTWYVNSR